MCWALCGPSVILVTTVQIITEGSAGSSLIVFDKAIDLNITAGIIYHSILDHDYLAHADSSQQS